MEKENGTFADKIERNFGVSLTDWIYLLMAIIVISGIVGFVYEELFYRIDLGHWVKRGIEYGPWIDIYAWGGLLLTFTVWWFRKHPLVVFLLSRGICGTLEYITGYLIIPVVKRFYDKPNGKGWKNTMMILCILYFIDVVVSYILQAVGINPR